MVWKDVLLCLILLQFFITSFAVDNFYFMDTAISYENQPNRGDGSYYFSYDTIDGSRMEKGEVITGRNNNLYILVTGSYKFTDPQGVIHYVEYTAGEDGYHQRKTMKKPSYAEASYYLPEIKEEKRKKHLKGSLIGGGKG